MALKSTLFSRGPQVPSGLKSLLDRDDRVLAVADSAGSVVIASTRGLWLPHETSWRCIGWHDVVKASWSSAGLTVIEGVADADGVVTDLPAVSVALEEPRNLPSVTRTRVESSIARTEQVAVPGGVGRLIARRVPGTDGVRWTGRVDSGTPATAEAHQALALKIRGMIETEEAAR